MKLDFDKSASRTSNIFVVGCLLVVIGLVGCQFGGKETTHEVILIEPGQTVEIADEHLVQCLVKVVKNGKEEEVVVKRKLAGTVAMPKTVYREMRKKAYPDEK